MAITSFSTLKSAVADWLDRDDMGDAIETMIGLAEARIYRDLRLRAMESSFAETISSGTVTVPANYLEFRHVVLDGSPFTPLEVRSSNWIYENYPLRSSDSKPLFYARDGTSFIFGPYPDSDYTVRGNYYAKLTALSTSNETNWFVDNAPDLLLYGTLVHAAPYVGHDERAALWSSAYEEAKDRVQQQDHYERFPRSMSLRVMTQ